MGKMCGERKKKSDFCTASVKDGARGRKCSQAIGLMWPKVVDWTGQNEDAAPLKTQDRNDNNVVVFKLSDWFDFLNYPSSALMSYGRQIIIVFNQLARRQIGFKWTCYHVAVPGCV